MWKLEEDTFAFYRTETSSEWLNECLKVTELELGEPRSPKFRSIKSYPYDHQIQVKPLCSHLISEQEILLLFFHWSIFHVVKIGS